MSRPHYVQQLITRWGEPKIAIDELHRVHTDMGWRFKKGWTWFPGNVNHSITLWISPGGDVQGVDLSCHDEWCLQIQARHNGRVLMPVEVSGFIAFAGWHHARLE